MNGQTFGKYQLLKKLATGGMAEVWLARQSGIEGFQKLCVVKRILPHLADDPEFVQMFLNEAKIAARFSHPNIAQIYDLGEVNGSYFIAMEFVHGEDLGRVMRKAWSSGQWIARPLAIRIVAAACEALFYAHTKADDRGTPLKVVHRDISPQNILISFDGSVKLVDFGIAKAADAQSMTRSGAIKGKFAYMAPEQAAGKPLDHRSDIFAMGLVLYELLTGVRPLKRDSELATLQAALECAIEAPSKVADVPEDLDPIVMAALTKSADDRYRDARTLQMALEEFLVSQRWVATSVQIAELMNTLFHDRLEEEARLGMPDPVPEDPSSTSGVPVAPEPPSDQSWDAPPAKEIPQRASRTMARSARSSESTRAPSPPPPPTPDVPGWDAPPAAEVPGQRRLSGETRAAPITRTASRHEVPAAPRRVSTTRAQAVEDDSNDPPRRTRSQISNPAVRRRTGDVPKVLQDDDDEPTQLPEEVSGDNALIARGKSGQYSLKTARRITREGEMPEAPLPQVKVKRRPSMVSAPKVEAPRPTAVPAESRQGVARFAVAGGVILLLALGGFAFRDSLKQFLTSTANDGAEIYVSVDSNLQVELYVQHAPEENRAEPLVYLGHNPLKKAGGVHVRDTLVFENKPLGLHYLYEIPFGQPGEHRQIVKDFKKGTFEPVVEPKSLTDLHLFIHGQEVGRYPGPKMELVEGKHTLEIRGSQLTRAAQFDIEVKPGGTTRKLLSLGEFVQK